MESRHDIVASASVRDARGETRSHSRPFVDTVQYNTVSEINNARLNDNIFFKRKKNRWLAGVIAPDVLAGNQWGVHHNAVKFQFLLRANFPINAAPEKGRLTEICW